MEFRLLGGVNLYTHGHDVDLGTRKQRTVLAALLLAEGRPISTDRLGHALWGDSPPADHRAHLATYVSRLRRVLSKHAPDIHIEHRASGYALTADPNTIDATRFHTAIARARKATAAGDDQLAAEEYDAALSLWRGEPLAGLTGDWTIAEAANLHRQHRDAQAEHIGTLLRLGRAAETLDVLHRLTAAYPLDEQFAAQLMQALHQAGRTAEALSHYDMMRRRLADELGADPSPSLQEVHLQLLRADPTRAAAHTGPLVPAQLPADIPAFTGRTEHLDTLDQLLQPGADTAAVVISAIAGTAGVGKTALAVHWAHRVRDRFPDGQLYVNLRGFDPAGAVMAPATAVRLFLDALDVPAQRIPADPDAQVNLYRSLLADKHMLVLLDNARDPNQVRPLLPGARGCLVLVTSRNQLTGLVAAEGAHHLALDLLTTDEARDLLARRLGPARVAAGPSAVDEIITTCTRLPLALVIVAARAEIAKDLPLTVLADQLRTGDGRLDALSTGDDPRTDLRAVFSWSYQALTPAAARLYRLLGLHPGPDISAPAAASLAGLTPDAVRPLLAELTQASLLAEPDTGRYTFHDLLRDYAAQLADTIDTDQQRYQTIGRILDHYLHTAHPAALLLNPTRDPVPLAPPQAGVTPEQLSDHEQAWVWFTVEHQVLLAAVAHAAATGFDTHTWQLTSTLQTFLHRWGHWHDRVAVGQAAVAAAQRLADPTTEARSHRNLASAYIQLGRLDDAHTQLHHALDLDTRTGDQTQQAQTNQSLAYLWERRGQPAHALPHARQALHLFQATGHLAGHARGLNMVGWCHALLGEHQQALTYCQQALTLFQQLEDRYGQAATWDSLGYAHHHLGQHTQAVTCYQHALTLFRDLGDRYYEATTLTRVGDTHHATGNPQAARDAWRQALTILDDLEHPDAERVRAKLIQLTSGS